MHGKDLDSLLRCGKLTAQSPCGSLNEMNRRWLYHDLGCLLFDHSTLGMWPCQAMEEKDPGSLMRLNKLQADGRGGELPLSVE